MIAVFALFVDAMTHDVAPKQGYWTFATLALVFAYVEITLRVLFPWSEERRAASELREALYPQRLEMLASFIRNNKYSNAPLYDKLLAICIKNGVEPGWEARREDPRPKFR